MSVGSLERPIVRCEPAAASPSASSDMVEVDLDELIVGRPLRYPVHDEDGLLLLAEGSIITPEFKKHLKSRRVRGVKLHAPDVAKVTFRAGAELSSEQISFDEALTAKLDNMIDNGMMSVVNLGPPVRDAVVVHGKRAFNARWQQKLRESHASSRQTLDGLMHAALRGGKVDSRGITDMTAAYLSELTQDADCLLSAAFDAAREPSLAQHCLRMATLGMAIGVEMGYDAANIQKIGLAGLVHDWGMTKVPAAIRDASRVLAESEYLEIKKHPIHTLELLQRVAGIPHVLPVICYQVHERPNGTGYPRGRSGNSIHPFASILQVADEYTALTSPRPYRRPLMPYAAMECLIHKARVRALDPQIVRCLLHVLSLFPIGSFVTLSDGSVARVLRRNGNAYAAPILQIVQDSEGHLCGAQAPGKIIDLNESDLKVIQAVPTPGHNEIALSPDVLTLNRSLG